MTAFAMDGPPLFLAGSKLGAVAQSGKDLPLALEGHMERTCMVGLGEIVLKDLESGLTCKGKINTGPSDKGRIKAILPCENSIFLILTLSNKGPDQGVGLAHFAKDSSAHAEKKAVRSNKPKKQDSSATPTALTAENLEISEEPPLVLFYHPWNKEAKRRLAETLVNMSEVLSNSNLK